MWIVSLAFAQSSPDTQRWAADARRQISTSWGACVDYLAGVPLPAPVYTTVAEAEVNADGTPATIRIVTPSGSPELDDCAVRAFRTSGRFPVPPQTMVAAGGTAHLSEIVLTLKNATAPPPAPVGGPLVDAVRDPAATAEAVARAPVRIATSANGTRNLWCGGTGAAPVCSIRDQRGSMLVFSVTVCHTGDDLTFGTAYGPMRVKAAADLLPGLPACKE
jgi:TonB family protein